MSHRFTSLLHHVVFSTKARVPFLDRELAPECHAYLGGILENIGARRIRIGGASDHVHLFFDMPATLCMADCVRLLKTNSSKWIHEKWRSRSKFGWQEGYSAFSVSKPSIERLVRYIDRQQEHHKRESFQDEVRRFLREYELQVDEEHMWE